MLECPSPIGSASTGPLPRPCASRKASSGRSTSSGGRARPSASAASATTVGDPCVDVTAGRLLAPGAPPPGGRPGGAPRPRAPPARGGSGGALCLFPLGPGARRPPRRHARVGLPLMTPTRRELRFLTVEQPEDGIALVTFDRPDRLNALSWP